MAITRILLISSALLVGGTPLWTAADHATLPAAIQTAAAPAASVTSRITVTVPHDEAELSVDGKTIPGTGTARSFEPPPLPRGTTRRYTFSATWRPNAYTTMTRSRSVSIRTGDPMMLDLSIDDPTDRVRVQYVPTPADIADEMVKLARVGSADVVYEPGCGDARITIAAVKGGARRGVGIDIDVERVADSRAKVREAGLDGTIEIRLGDALDIKDLSAATVVFLYMGDHFNLLIRPILWRELKVGARIVSHRFTMGDWKPDETLSVNSVEGGEYELHLWTVTEEIKRRAERGRRGADRAAHTRDTVAGMFMKRP